MLLECVELGLHCALSLFGVHACEDMMRGRAHCTARSQGGCTALDAAFKIHSEALRHINSVLTLTLSQAASFTEVGLHMVHAVINDKQAESQTEFDTRDIREQSNPKYIALYSCSSLACHLRE